MPKFENFTTPFITAHCHFNSAHFLLITAHFVYHCTLKKTLVPLPGAYFMREPQLAIAVNELNRPVSTSPCNDLSLLKADAYDVKISGARGFKPIWPIRIRNQVCYSATHTLHHSAPHKVRTCNDGVILRWHKMAGRTFRKLSRIETERIAGVKFLADNSGSIPRRCHSWCVITVSKLY